LLNTDYGRARKRLDDEGFKDLKLSIKSSVLEGERWQRKGSKTP
jgi:hypothetical protein